MGQSGPRRSALRACVKILPWLFAAQETVGGQAVMEGVMIRSKNRLAIAVRKPGGEILVHTRPWFSLTDKSWLKKPFVRDFPFWWRP